MRSPLQYVWAMYGTPPFAAIQATTSCSGANSSSGMTGSASTPSASTCASCSGPPHLAFSSMEGMTRSFRVERSTVRTQ